MFQFGEILFPKGIVAGILSFVILCSCISPKPKIPKVIDDIIFFHNSNTQIKIGEKDIYYTCKKQGRFVYISKQLKSNYYEYQMIFYDFEGNKISQTDIIKGELDFIFSETAERILVGQRAMLIRENISYLYDLDGNLINKLIHDYESKQIGITEDERYFWFAANKMKPLSSEDVPLLPGMTHYPYSHIMIFDVHTGEFITSYSTSESYFNFTINKKEYYITVSSPDIPG